MMRTHIRRGSDQRGMALFAILFMLLIAVPAALFTYKLVMQTIKSAVVHGVKQKKASDYANDAIVDYMRQLSNNPYASLVKRSELIRPPMTMPNGLIEFAPPVLDKPNRTLSIEGTGKFGMNPANPDAKQTLHAVIKYQSDLTYFAQDLTRIATFNPNVVGVTYEGPIIAQNISIDASNIRFLGGPLISQNTFSNLNMGSITNPFVDGDLYVGGSISLKSGTTIAGHTYRKVPFAPDFFLDFQTYDILTSTGNGSKYLSPVTLWFQGDGTYKRTTFFNTYISGLTAGLDAGTAIWSSTLPVPTNGIFLAKGCNIGVMGKISPRITVVALGDANSESQGNVVILDDLWYLDTDGVSISSQATTNSSLGLLALNRIWMKKVRQNENLSIRGVMYMAYGVSRPGGTAFSDLRVEMFGPSNKTFYFSGTRNSMFRLEPSPSGGGCSYCGGAGNYFAYDPKLVLYPPPGLPERPLLVSYSIE